MEWSSKDLIEEELLKNATAESICGWLKAHADENFWALNSNFPELREKYEPIWSADENSALKMSVCLYGRDFKTLRSLFYSELPNHFKEAVLRNPSFACDAGLYSTLGLCLLEEDILRLYEKYKKSQKDRFFLTLFENPALPEEFIRRIFRKQKPYQDISDKHLLEIFQVMFQRGDKNYFYQNKLKYSVHHNFKADGQLLANEIIQFIPKIQKISEYNKNYFCSPYIAFSIEYFLESSKDLDTYGISDEKTLLTFCDKLDNAERNFDDEQLISIQMELGRRAFSGVWRNGNKEQLLALGKSDYARIRSIHYQCCDLSLIYNLPYWKLEHFFNNTSTSYINLVLWGEGEPPEPISGEYQLTLKSLAEFLKKDRVFAAAIALNEKHYTSRMARMFLQEICRQGDILGNNFPWPLGNGTCVDIFMAKCESLKNEYPEYFEDETPERILLKKTDSLGEMLLDIRSSVEKHTNQQAALNKINVSQLDSIKQKVDAQQRRLDQIDRKITELQINFSERVRDPTDFGSGFLYSMPIIGSLLRAIFK